VTGDMNWKDLPRYFVHGIAFSTLFFVLAIVWVSALAFLTVIGAIIGFIIGLVLLFLVVGFANSLVTSFLWFKVKFGFWDFLFHGFVLFVTLLIINLILTVPTLVSPGIATTVVTYIIATFVEGFVAKKLAGWWQEEYAKRLTMNWKDLLRYFVHGAAFSTLFLGLAIAWAFVSSLLGIVDAIIVFIIGFMLLFLMVGFLNSVITSYLWFKVKFGFWDFLFHGVVLFGTLLILNLTMYVHALVSGIAITAVTYVITAFLDGFVAKKLAGWWQEEYAKRLTLKSLLGSPMLRYIVRRLLYMIPVFLGISIISFFVMYAAGDPIDIITLGRPAITQEAKDALRAYYGLDKPVPVQYLNWLTNLLQGNFGKSLYGGRPVNRLIGNWAWETIKLQLISILTAFAISIPIGINSAKKQYSKQDITVTSISLFGVSMPTFWLGLILIIIFSFQLGWLPSAGARGAPYLWWDNPILDQLAHLIMPVTVLVYVMLAQNVRLIRANMLEILRSDYILSARASGLSERKVIYKYALRNAIGPVITYLGISLGAIIAGAPMTEYVFNWPGLGRRFVDAAMRLDFPLVMGITMIITIMTLIANLIIDICYVYIDPRIRLR
jgi:ABC-type dipeptide/oligopeptide/nickel transport system permease component